MTREHIPPDSTGNDSPVGRIDRPFDIDAIVTEVAEWNEGHVVRTLGRKCNSRASDWGYVSEYRKWHDHFKAAHVAGRTTKLDPFRGATAFSIDLPYDAMPARMIRQTIGMFLAVQESEILFASSTQLVDVIGPEEGQPTKARSDGLDIAPKHLYLGVYSGPWTYNNMPIMSTTLNPWPAAARASKYCDIFVLGLAPFAFILTDQAQPGLGLDITDWATWGLHQRPKHVGLEVPTVDMLEGPLRAMLYPDDYISR